MIDPSLSASAPNVLSEEVVEPCRLRRLLRRMKNNMPTRVSTIRVTLIPMPAFAPPDSPDEWPIAGSVELFVRMELFVVALFGLSVGKVVGAVVEGTVTLDVVGSNAIPYETPFNHFLAGVGLRLASESPVTIVQDPIVLQTCRGSEVRCLSDVEDYTAKENDGQNQVESQ